MNLPKILITGHVPSSKPYQHPTARVEGNSVVITGNTQMLENRLHYLVNGSGAKWTRTRDGLRLDHPIADPQTIADAINKASENL